MEGGKRGDKDTNKQCKKRNEIRHSKEREGKQGRRRGRSKSKDGKESLCF